MVFMDTPMQQMESIEATTIIREQEKSIGTRMPVSAMTAAGMVGDPECGIVVEPGKELSTKSDPMVPDGSVEVVELLDRIDDDRALLAEIVGIFRREYPLNLEAAQRAIDARRLADLERVAHALRGTLSNLSATRASALAAELEAIGRSTDLTGAQTILDTLVLELGKVMRALEALCPVVA